MSTKTRTNKDFSHHNPFLEIEEGVVLGADLQDDVFIDNSNLEEEFLNQPEIFAWWASTCELAKDLVAKQKFLLERLSATLDNKIRLDAEQLSIDTGKPVKLTETKILHMINTNEEYQRATFQHLEFKKQLGLLQAGKDAVEQRKEMLISLGANYRAEASSNPSILKDASRERARRAVDAQRAHESHETRTPQPVRRPVGKKPA